MSRSFDSTNLDVLEAESISIFREVMAQFERPVMLYSIGKDSSVLLHLARKAFYPGKIPFPLLHVDTGWKFREMIEFRDRMAEQYGFTLLVHTNKNAKDKGINPFDYGSSYTDLMKTEALKQALNKYKFDAAFGYRNFMLQDENGKRIAVANSQWILVDTESGRVVRITPEIASHYPMEEKQEG